MATERQIEANRKNAQRSTGPRSAEGKSRVGSNALKHGLTAKQVVLPHEDPKEFETFASELWDAIAPVGALEGFQAERFVIYAWRTRRGAIIEAALHARAKQEAVVEKLRRRIDDYDMEPLHQAILEEGPPKSPGYNRTQAKLKAAIRQLDEQPLSYVTNLLEPYERQFANLARHEEGLQRSMLRTLHEIQRLQAQRLGRDVPAPAVLDLNVDINSKLASINDSESTPPLGQDEEKPLE